MTVNQTLLCLVIGAGELIWGFLIKFAPLWIFQIYKFDESAKEDDEDEVGGGSIRDILKHSSTMKRTSGNVKAGTLVK